MKLNKRLSSYPILINDDDDYVDSSFDIELEHVIEFNELNGNVVFYLNNNGLQQLIDENKAQFAIHVECSELMYREIFYSQNNKLQFKVDLNNLSGKVEISSFILAIEDIDKYYNDKFNMFYSDPVHITKGNTLAVGSIYDLNIDRSNHNYEKISDVIRIQKQDNLDQMTVLLESDVITIFVNENIKNMYFTHGEQKLYNVISMMLVPAMIQVLISMKNNPDLKAYKWYEVIERVLNANNIEVDKLSELESEGKNSILVVAQKIFKSPLEKGFLELSNGGVE